MTTSTKAPALYRPIPEEIVADAARTSPLSNQRPEEIRSWLLGKLSEVLKTDPGAIDTSAPLTRFGLDSMDAITLSGDLEDWLELRLPSTLLWDYPTIDGMVAFLTEVPAPDTQAGKATEAVGSRNRDAGMPDLDGNRNLERDGDPA